MHWQTYSVVVAGKARTRGAAQVITQLVGGAEPPPHIGRQSRGVVELFLVRRHSRYEEVALKAHRPHIRQRSVTHQNLASCYTEGTEEATEAPGQLVVS